MRGRARAGGRNVCTVGCSVLQVCIFVQSCPEPALLCIAVTMILSCPPYPRLTASSRVVLREAPAAEDCLAAVRQAFAARAWAAAAGVVTMPSHAQLRAELAGCQVGVAGVLSRVQDSRVAMDATVSAALRDLSGLMESAREMVNLAERLRASVDGAGGGAGAADDADGAQQLEARSLRCAPSWQASPALPSPAAVWSRRACPGGQLRAPAAGLAAGSGHL